MALHLPGGAVCADPGVPVVFDAWVLDVAAKAKALFVFSFAALLSSARGGARLLAAAPGGLALWVSPRRLLPTSSTCAGARVRGRWLGGGGAPRRRRVGAAAANRAGDVQGGAQDEEERLHANSACPCRFIVDIRVPDIRVIVEVSDDSQSQQSLQDQCAGTPYEAVGTSTARPSTR